MPERLIALATGDPLALGTFSGLSANLFGAIADAGVEVEPMRSRVLRGSDLLTGAIAPGALLHPRRSVRGLPRLDPDWLWSRRTYERFCRRLDRKLARRPGTEPILQVGTHVRPTGGEHRLYCITDATIVQALAAPQLTVSRTSRRTLDEAIECQREVLSSCEKVFTLSRWAAQSVTDDFGVDPSRVVVTGAGANLRSVPAATEVGGTAPGPGGQAPGPPGPYVLFVGVDWVQKGGPLLLEGFRLARRTIPEAQLKVVGCRPEIDEPGVEVIGYLDQNDPEGRRRLGDLYARATCLALLSEFDAFPNVLLEAGSVGVPVLSTRDGSRPEVVTDGVTGILIGERTPAAVGDALVGLLGRRDVARRMGLAARERIEGHFTWRAVTTRILSEIDSDGLGR